MIGEHVGIRRDASPHNNGLGGPAGFSLRKLNPVQLFRERCGTNGSCWLLEAGDGFGFAVINIENRQQLGDLQDFLEFGAQITKL